MHDPIRHRLGYGLAVLCLLCTFLTLGCGGVDRQACYAANELAADAEIRKRCIYKGHKWSDCPDRQAILDELAAAHRSCP